MFFKNWLYRFTQKILLVIAYFIAYILANLKIEGKEIVRKIPNGPLIVVANHKSYFDPILVGVCFPFFSRIYPLRFMTKDIFFRGFFSRLMFKSLGCYPTLKKRGMKKALKIPDKLLRQGKTVVLFPEGKCTQNDELSRPQPGAVILASRFPTVPILPVALAGTYKIRGSLFALRRQKIRIKIGKPFCFNDIKIAVGENSDRSALFIAEIEKLYQEINQIS